MAQKPSIPKGTRDFGPSETARRNHIFDTIRTVFRIFGYTPIETPAMENLSTLLGKYGEEGDKLLYRILNSGDAFSGIDFDSFRIGGESEKGYNSKALSLKVCEKGLRYDLTVPFARFVAQHRDELTFPFRRSQIQPVWRADRPQKGRYREFHQCDADIIGTSSLLCELELVQMVDEVFSRLGVRVCMKINNRKILSGLAEICGCPEKVVDLTVAIDKIDKIGLEAVEAEMLSKGLGPEAVSRIRPVLTMTGDAPEKLAFMRSLFEGGDGSPSSETGLKGLDETKELFSLIGAAGIRNKVELDLSLARGLNYYTGAIFEVKSLDFEIGSICGGGRYDNLTGIFGLPGMSGVGISFGADRIYDVLTGLDKFPSRLNNSADILFANMGAAEARYAISAAVSLRTVGIACEVYPETAKLKKQFDYADRRHIRFISINGETEIASSGLNLKNLSTGEQILFPIDDIASIVSFITK